MNPDKPARSFTPLVTGFSDSPLALKGFLDHMPVGVVFVDLQLRVKIMNRILEALTGYTTEEAFGLPCQYILKTNVCAHTCPAHQANENGKSLCTEANIISRNRQKIPVRLTSAALLASEGHLAGYIEFVEDMRFQQPDPGQADPSFFFGKLIGRSPEMQRIFQVLPVVAQTDSSVLITGQTGTGKDFVAEAIHQASNRSKGPFIKVNCGALPETLLESELFGHDKGAYTGALESRPGRFRLAHGGTLYLTEIGDLPLNLQVKLLSFLDDRVVHPLGSSKSHHVDVRIIAATHRHLDHMVQEGRFRQDLLFRLHVIRINLPPLCQRGDDLKMLMDHFLNKFNPRFKKKIMDYSLEAKKILYTYAYPGNVRELRNIVEYAVNICDSHCIQPEHLPEYILNYQAEPGQTDTAAPSPLTASPWSTISRIGEMNWRNTEKQILMEALLKSQGRKGEACKLLGWGRSTLWRKMKKHGLL